MDKEYLSGLILLLMIIRNQIMKISLVVVWSFLFFACTFLFIFSLRNLIHSNNCVLILLFFFVHFCWWFLFSIFLWLADHRNSKTAVQRQITPNGYHNNGRDISSPSHNDSDYKYGRFDASALHIAHALKQTEIQKAYNKRREKPIDYYLVSTHKKCD